MKNYIIFTFIFFAFITTSFSVPNIKEKTTQSAFCEGWDEGYCEGWKEIKGALSICPIAPICPIPDIGKNSYKGGYNTGFRAGMKAARE